MYMLCRHIYEGTYIHVYIYRVIYMIKIKSDLIQGLILSNYQDSRLGEQEALRELLTRARSPIPETHVYDKHSLVEGRGMTYGKAFLWSKYE